MRYRTLLCLLVVTVMVTGCSGTKGAFPEKKNNGNRESVQVNPFTGEKAPKTGSGPPFMVMVNNHPKARPQTGLNRAGLVVEVLAEGEITRLAAFYYGNREGTVGPVRSTRPYYLDLAEGPKAVVVHAGGSPAALRRIRDENLPSLDGIHGDGAYFRREQSRRSPHNLYTDLTQLRKGANKKGFTNSSLTGPYRFEEKEPKTKGASATHIGLKYHRLYEAGYRFDRETGRYIRYTQGNRQTDLKTGKPLSMNNVLVIRAPHRVIDSSGRREVDLNQGGEGVLFRDGKAFTVRWENREGWIVPSIDGKTVPFHPGRTWIQVLPENGELSYRP
ncbi:Protein of unknown function (DUF3048) [Melghirimyces profundicolus]|uniref:DUF3048 family protein n=1 Tax=Melghirimyces profundicolus TaxID=1242148 RepID=A0A2T6AYK1_9BACL|nr:DUF3048 domain-containing protein [Melghirimyces profundicolus]PTX48888.1 Protein of unknown function (DUF3048) [Melghirimyces profundicolus]